MSEIPQTLILGAVDLIAEESQALAKVVDKLCRYFQCDFARLCPLITDFISCGPSVYTQTKYHDTMHKADSLGLTGAHCHVIDQGGASITAAIMQAQACVQQNPHAVILVAGADIPRAGFQGKADYAFLNQGVMHPVHEEPYGGNLVAFYALLAKQQMRDEGITAADFQAIVRYYRATVQANPRAHNFAKELSDKQLTKYFAEPYSVPMIAVATDHAVATLICGEAILAELQQVLTLPGAPAYVGHGATAHHAAYFTLKGDLASPASVTGPLVLERNGLGVDDVDYAWVYDCFVGMLIGQTSQYFGVSQQQAAQDLASGGVRLPSGKFIPINQGGGILNYQAALMLSSGTGLLDVLSRFGLAADPLYPAPPNERPGVALLGGNGGLDTVNSLVPIASRPFAAPRSRTGSARAPLRFNNPAKSPGDLGRIRLTTTVHFNTGGAMKPPYVLALSELSNGNFTLSNVYENGERLTSDAGLPLDTPVRFEEIDGVSQAVPVAH